MEKCAILKNTFGGAVSNFTLCSITNSHPIKLCQECIHEYLDMIDSHNALLLVIYKVLTYLGNNS